ARLSPAPRAIDKKIPRVILAWSGNAWAPVVRECIGARGHGMAWVPVATDGVGARGHGMAWAPVVPERYRRPGSRNGACRFVGPCHVGRERCDVLCRRRACGRPCA